MSEDCQVCGQPIYDSEVLALRARVAQLEAALNDLRPNVDYHGHKKLDAAQSCDLAARETIERLQRALQGIFPLAKATADRVAFYEDIDTNAALAGADAALSSTPAPAPSQSDEEKAKWLARSCRITGQDQNLLRTERQVAADILAAFATIRAEAKR